MEALNHALRDIPRDRVRFHTCYSINMGTFAGSSEIPPTVAWAKLKSLTDGARLATKTLWGRT